MASGPITSWQIDGETVETVSDFTFGGSKITADGDCSHKIKEGKLNLMYPQPVMFMLIYSLDSPLAVNTLIDYILYHDGRGKKY